MQLASLCLIIICPKTLPVARILALNVLPASMHCAQVMHIKYTPLGQDNQTNVQRRYVADIPR